MTSANEEMKNRRHKLAEAINDVKKDYNKKEQGDYLKILGPMINSLAVASAAQVLNRGTPALLLSLQIALQGIEKETCEAGVIGNTLNKITEGVVELVVHTFLAKEDIGSRQLFKLVTQLMILASIGVTWKLEQFKLNLKGDSGQLFELEIMLLLILNSGIVKQIVERVATTCGANKEQQEMITKLVNVLLLMLMIFTAAKGQQERLRVLTLDLKEYLIEGLNSIQAFINKASEAEKTGRTASVMNIFIQQALSSLQDDNFESAFGAYKGALNEIEATPDSMDSDIDDAVQFAELIYNAFTRGSIDLSRMTATHMI